MKGNYVGADFCSRHFSQVDSNNDLLLNLQNLGFVYEGIYGYILSTQTNFSAKANVQNNSTEEDLRVAAEKLTVPGTIFVDFRWHVDEKIYDARIYQVCNPDSGFMRFSFHVNETVFFHKANNFVFDSIEDRAFEKFKLALIEIVKHADPVIGIVEYDSDLICESPQYLPLVGWGNYLPWSILKRWRPSDSATLLETADEIINVDDFGLFFFIFPLMSIPPWTEKHEQIQELYAKYAVLSLLGPND